jgi:tripartite-type tricarboxylate transporter receptor subunit TctC
MTTFIFRVAMVLTGVVACSANAAAQDFFKGKQITLYVGYAPGGGYDSYARTFARHYPRHIAGNPDIVVKNMPGAGSVKLANYLYNSARKDGREIGALGREVPTSSVLGVENAKFTASRFTWLGSLGAEGTYCVAWHGTPFRTTKDILEKPFIVGGTNGRSMTVTTPVILNNLVGTKIKVIAGYPGSAALHLAMERGEIQGRCASTISSTNSSRPDWIPGKKITFLLDISLAEKRHMPDVPLITEFARTPEERQALELLLAPDSWTRPFVAPPDVAPAQATQLKAAFVRTYEDAKLKADMDRQKIVLDPMSGDAMAARIDRLEKIPAPIVKIAIDASKKTDRTEMTQVVVPVEKATGAITKVENDGRKVSFEAGAKKGRLDVSSSGTKVTIGGKAAKRKQLKAGLACDFAFQGTVAKAIACH